MPYPFNIYDFIIEPIRLQDQKTKFLERYLKGPQNVANTTWDKIQSVKQLFDWELTPDEALRYLLWHVGFTRDLDYIVQELDYDDLRRLLGLAIPMWKSKGVPSGLEGTVRSLVGRDPQIFDWFHLRYEEGKTYFGEEWLGDDPFFVEEVGAAARDEHYSIAFVEDTYESINQTLLADIFRLCRPLGERFDIFLCNIFDQFTVGFDRWSVCEGSDNLSLENGVLVYGFGLGGHVKFNINEAVNWKSYITKWRVKIEHQSTSNQTFGISVYMYPGSGTYDDQILCIYRNDTKTASIWKRINDSWTVEATTSYYIPPEAWFTWTIVIDHQYEGETEERIVIKWYLDGDLVIEKDWPKADVPNQGTVGFRRTVNTKCYIDWVRLQKLPIVPINVGPA